MRRLTVDLAIITVLAGLVALGAASLWPGNRPLVIDVYVLFLGGLLLVALVQSTRVANPSTGGSALELALGRDPEPAEPLPQLARLEREVALASVTAFDLHIRLRRSLREVAAHRLAASSGVDLELEPERARQLMSPETWDVVRPDRPPPVDRQARGPSLAELTRVVDELERI